MSTIVVTGGTGDVGSAVVHDLLQRQHRVRVYSHRKQPPVPQHVEVYQGDIHTGSGLAQAVQGADVIIHCASNSKEADFATDLQGTRHLIQAARDHGSPHIVYISIVGIDRSEFPYYKAKLAVEQLIEQSNLPWTILRTTQFHTLVLGIIKAAEQTGDSPLVIPGGLRFQSIEHTEVAQRLVELAERAPAGRVPDMGGPQIMTLEEMADIYLRVYQKPGPVQSEPITGNRYAAFRSGVNIVPDHKVGRITWEEFLRQRQ